MKRSMVRTALASFALAGTLVAGAASPALAKISAAGKAKIVFQGTATPQSDGTILVHVTKATGNAKNLKNTDASLAVRKTTKVTQNGRKIKSSAIPAGAKVKVWAIFDKDAQMISSVTWVKVIK